MKPMLTSAHTPGSILEEISKRSIKPKKLAALEHPKKKEDKRKKGSGAIAAPESSTSDEEEEQEEVLMVQVPWMQAYLAYIINQEIPEDPVEARRVIRRSKAFTFVVSHPKRDSSYLRTYMKEYATIMQAVE
jgi:hypothetical protein